MKNRYSRQWFEVFAETIEPSYTRSEIDFLTRQLPLAQFKQILDVGCGEGRHSNLSASLGYSVTGIDRDGHALSKARRAAPPGAEYIEMDTRKLKKVTKMFDAVICLWQSFGYFDSETNFELLQEFSEKMRSNGRLILDIYHKTFFEEHQGTRVIERAGIVMTEEKWMTTNRLTVKLNYETEDEPDYFEWQLYTPEEISDLASQANLELVLACTGFDEEQPATPASPRMQLIFKKR